MSTDDLHAQQFRDTGWMRFPPSAALLAWIAAAGPAAAAVAASPDHAKWHRHGGTWFVGVNALPNDEAGALPGGPALQGAAVDFARSLVAPGVVAFDRGQVSICSPGYPKRDPDQSEASHRYRVQRDAAHVDGLHAEGPARRRYVREHHAFILGIPLSDVAAGQSPFVVWEGSHHVMRQAFTAALSGIDPASWPAIDLTDCYHEARRRCFATCRRVEITAQAGEAYVIHRLALHGMAPWTARPGPPRTIIYFRPLLSDPQGWLYE